MQDDATACRNCGSPLKGEYCASCGQREGRGDLRFTEAVGDIVGDIFTWDSRLWKTLWPLMLRPGYLSAEFNAGRRARYMPPFRLYIVISFVLFFVLSFIARDSIRLNGDEDADVAPVTVTRDLEGVPEEYRDEVREALERRDQARADTDAVKVPPTAPAGEASDGNGGGNADLEDGVDSDDTDGISVNLADENSPAWLKSLDRRLETNIQRVRDDPRDFMDSLVEYLPQTMFLMLPIFALLLRLLYLFSPFHYLQHLVFALHYHSFVYLLYLLSELLDLTQWQAGDFFALPLLIYLPLALRKTYGSSWKGAIGKSVAIGLSYSLVLVTGFAVVLIAAIALM